MVNNFIVNLKKLDPSRNDHLVGNITILFAVKIKLFKIFCPVIKFNFL